MNACSGERGHDCVCPVDRCDAKGRSRSCGSALPGGETNEIGADGSYWHRNGQTGHSAREEVADHDRRKCARPRRPRCSRLVLR